MKTLPPVHRIALLFNGSKIYDRGIIAGIGNYLSSTRASWDLFLEEDFLCRLRGIERWGSADMVEQAFSGFVGLPAPSKTEWWREVLGLPAGPVTAAEIDAAFRARAAAAHPDTGGSDVAMANLNRARADAKASIA